MSKLLGGSQTSETKIPAYMEDQSKDVIARSNQAAGIGYTPYYGPDVAALSPLEEAAMQNTASAANAFGMTTPQSDPLAQINGTTTPVDPSQYQNQDAASAINNAYRNQLGRDPDQAGFDFWMQNYNPDTFANDFAAGTRMDPLTGLTMPGTTNGVRGYSSAPMFESAVQELKDRRPAQHEALLAPFINSVTGAPSQYDQMRAQQAQQAQGLMAQFMPDYAGNADPSGNGQSAGFGGFGGYGGLGDMFDGGGPGQSGTSFGGALGGVSNGLGKEPGQGFFGGLFG